MLIKITRLRKKLTNMYDDGELALLVWITLLVELFNKGFEDGIDAEQREGWFY